MKKVFLLSVASLLALPFANATPGSKQMTVVGYVLDSACLFVKDLKKPVSRECALRCAAAGSPLVILAGDGTVYWPIDDKNPARGQNDRLVDLAGKHVKVTGQVYEHGSSKAIVMKTIEESAE